MISFKNDIIKLRNKIYLKQKKYMENCFNDLYNSEIEKKNANNEILLLEEILDIKHYWYDLETKNFWKSL